MRDNEDLRWLREPLHALRDVYGYAADVIAPEFDLADVNADADGYAEAVERVTEPDRAAQSP